MKDHGSIVSSTAKALIFLHVGMSTLATMHLESQMVKESTNGKMALYIRASSKMALKTEKENGENKRTQTNAINSKECIPWTKKMAKVLSLGRVATSTMEPTSTTKGKVMVKCTGQMDPSTKESGRKEYSTVKV